MSDPDRLVDFTASLRRFAADRAWEQFHTPKNLVMALAGEVGELAAELQWLTPEETLSVRSSPDWDRVQDEMADVFIYLVRLADIYGLDLISAGQTKMARNASRFPSLEPGEGA